MLEAHMPGPIDVDDIMIGYVQELVVRASGPAWQEQCLGGQAIELIAQHCLPLQPEQRWQAFSSLILLLGRSSGIGASAKAAAVAAGAGPSGPSNVQAEVLKRCLWVFWGFFPGEVFALLVVITKRALHLDDGLAEEASLPSIGLAGVRKAAEPEDMQVVILCLLLQWTVLRDKVQERSTVQEAMAGLREYFGEMQVDSDPGERGAPEDFMRAALDLAVLPLLTDTLLCLAVKDSESALALLPAMQASVLWQDAFNSGANCTVNLNEMEWFLILCDRFLVWRAAHSEAEAQISAAAAPRLVHYGHAVRPGPGMVTGEAAAKAERASLAARDAFLDWARGRLRKDRFLLEPQKETQTVLPDSHWEALRRAAACRVLLLLLDCFEGELDFQGALQDLAVAVAESPWMLKLLEPRHARDFLKRLALIPTQFPRIGPNEDVRHGLDD